ncbi:MAG: metallophosphoesterase, partial [Candidatus Eisenbacteria bacterium]
MVLRRLPRGLSALLPVLGLVLAGSPAHATAWTWGDTLTTVWKPLPNLPALARPGDTLSVWANAPGSASGWSAVLTYGNYAAPLVPAGGGYDPSRVRWELGFVVPSGVPEETYDLVLQSNMTAPDTSRHSVKVLPAFKTNYYFAQISDTHLPEHTFSTPPGGSFSTADTSGFPDFNAVAEDLNLIHPEFILHTGDLVNEGELEDYLAMFEMSRAQAALSRLRDPIFVVTGNHDIGGWQATAPPDGTARRNWWKIFGWPYLDNPPVGDPVHSQNFAFDYGTLHCVGLETYINNGSYDSFRTGTYGAQSFTPEQMNWLTAHLAAVPPGRQKLLFYHYDFGGTLGNGSPGANFSQINPATLGVDGAIWGHNHGVAEGNRTA